MNDKQLFGNATQLPQHKPDLFDAIDLAQVGVDHQHAVGMDLRVARSQHLWGNVISRFQHRADGRYFRSVIGDEMNKHCRARPLKKPWPPLQSSNTNDDPPLCRNLPNFLIKG
ncbi:MAG TPA: hypothetical protein VN968_18050 [Bradyrhizobium sp.]|nr:hypothetical protein [Bradyrhizobium sp.]